MGYRYRPSGVWLLDPLVHLKNNTSRSLVDDLTQKYDIIYVENHCATNRKVAGSIHDGDIGIFHWHNPSGRTMVLGSTRPWREMSARNVSWGVKAAAARADNLKTFMCRVSWNLRAPTSWNPQGLSSFTFTCYMLKTQLNCMYKWCYTDWRHAKMSRMIECPEL